MPRMVSLIRWRKTGNEYRMQHTTNMTVARSSVSRSSAGGGRPPSEERMPTLASRSVA